MFPAELGGDALALYEAAAIAAAHDLGVFASPRGKRTGETVRNHRMLALLNALVHCGVLTRVNGVSSADDLGFRIARVPPRPEVPAEGWGRLAEVIRTDTPLPIDDVAPYHAHLLRAGAPAARELAARLHGQNPGRTGLPELAPAAGEFLLDLGAGAGAYTEAWLDAWPEARATVVDAPEVIALARANLARFGDRVTFVAGDARAAEVPAHDVVLLANVLHLHGRDESAALIAAAVRATAEAGRVVVVDFDPASPEGVWFALDMALYTPAGRVHSVPEMAGWFLRAGYRVEASRLAAAPELVVATATPSPVANRPGSRLSKWRASSS